MAIVWPDTTKAKSKALPRKESGADRASGARSELRARIWEIVERLEELREGDGPVLIVHDYACSLVELSEEYLTSLFE